VLYKGNASTIGTLNLEAYDGSTTYGSIALTDSSTYTEGVSSGFTCPSTGSIRLRIRTTATTPSTITPVYFDEAVLADANAVGIGNAVSSLSAIGSSPNANGATVAGNTLNLQPASASFGGVVTTGAQTFAGVKTFSSTIVGNIDTATALFANPVDCSAGQFASAIAANGDLTCSVPGSGNYVSGPASSTDNAITRFDSTTGKVIQNSAAILDDTGKLTLAATAGTTGTFKAYELNANSHASGNSTFVAQEVNVVDNGGAGAGTYWGVSIPSPNIGIPVDNWASLRIGTAAGFGNTYSDAIRVEGGRSYFGGNIALKESGSTDTISLAAPSIASSYTLTLPVDDGNSGEVLSTNGSGSLSWITRGDLSGPGSSTDNAIVRYDGTTGKLVQNSNALVYDGGNVELSNTTETDFGLKLTKTHPMTTATATNDGVLIDYNVAPGISQTSSQATGLNIDVDGSGGNNIDYLYGTKLDVYNGAGGTNTATYGQYMSATVATGTHANLYGLYLTTSSSEQEATNAYGLYIQGWSNASSTPWSVYVADGNSYFGGNVTLGSDYHLTINKPTVHTGEAPGVSSCGTSPSIVGNDTTGAITVGTGGAATSCTITFDTAATNAPHCVVSNDTDIAANKVVTTTSTMVVTQSSAFTAGAKLNYICMRHE
jgi:hypothetical protein